MEVLMPRSHASGKNWHLEEMESTSAVAAAKWTPEENKAFENALAIYDQCSPDLWENVAAMIPGKSVSDVINQYWELEMDIMNIEAGLVPIPRYHTSPFTLDWATGGGGYTGFKPGHPVGNQRSPSGKAPEQERKKGVPWTEEEHRLFLKGLKRYGKGDWRSISRDYVVTRTPTQVASHAQKYFIRQQSGGKDKRRASIHDITTENVEDEEEEEVSIQNSRNSNGTGQDHLLATSSSAAASFPWDIGAANADNTFSNNQLHFYDHSLLPPPYHFHIADSVSVSQNAAFLPSQSLL